MTHRNYITAQEVADITSVSISKVTKQVLDEAETMVDNAIAIFYKRPFVKAFNRNYVASGVATTASLVTIPNASNTNGIFNCCVIQILSGTKAGTISNITSNDGNTISFNSIDGLTGTVDFRVYQAGKAPFIKDVFGGNKIIADEVKKAVAYQVEFLLSSANTPDSVKKRKGVKSESISSSYSYTLEDKSNGTKSPLELLAPQSAQLLSDAGLTYQGSY